MPTVRDDDGLALSSRNRHLSAGERGDAVVLSRALRAAADRAAGGATLGEVLQTGRALVEAAGGVDIDYFDALDPADASAVTSDYRGEVIIAVAARVGATRLIDNVTARIG